MGAELDPVAIDPGRRPPVLAVDDVVAGYGENIVLQRVSITVHAASVVALVGPNGAGKTTLLRTVCGLLPVRDGRIHIGGVDVTRQPAHRRAHLGLCYIPEGRGIFRSLTVRENLRLQARRGGEAQAVERAEAAFPVLGKRLSQAAGTLSGGEQQMLAVMQAYVGDPKVIVVDEASLGLAPRVVDEILEFLRSATANGASLLLVDQFVERALAMADYAYVLNHGIVAHHGEAASLRSSDLFEHYMSSDRADEARDAEPARPPIDDDVAGTDDSSQQIATGWVAPMNANGHP
jgi:branched-chain amino acid transport system ATP-binding protein